MKAHGEFRIKVHEKYLEIKIYGKWNYEGIIELIADFKKSASKINKSAWGVLTDLTEWELSTPDTENPMKKLQEWCMEHNQRYEATVIGDRYVKKYQMNHYLEGVDSSIIQHRYFKTVEDALKWFKSLSLLS